MGGDATCEHRVRENAATATSTLAGGKATTGHQREGFREMCPRCGAVRVDEQIGLEQTPAEYISNLVAVFREVWRVLKDDGTLWLNLGDSYAGGGNYRGINSEATLTAKQNSNRGARGLSQALGAKNHDVKDKDLLGIPWRVAFALQDFGWYLRSDIIWHKPNPMPESVTDRPTKAHEYVFLLTKSARYYSDMDAIAEPSVNNSGGPFSSKYAGAQLGHGGESNYRKARDNFKRENAKNGQPEKPQKRDDREDSAYDVTTRNVRTVWTIPTQPYSGAHFATMPQELARRCILAGSRPGDIVLDPFSGSGTTGRVAAQYGRRYVGVELNPEYVALHAERMTVQTALLFQEAEAA